MTTCFQSTLSGTCNFFKTTTLYIGAGIVGQEALDRLDLREASKEFLINLGTKIVDAVFTPLLPTRNSATNNTTQGNTTTSPNAPSDWHQFPDLMPSSETMRVITENPAVQATVAAATTAVETVPDLAHGAGTMLVFNTVKWTLTQLKMPSFTAAPVAFIATYMAYPVFTGMDPLQACYYTTIGLTTYYVAKTTLCVGSSVLNFVKKKESAEKQKVQ